MRAFLARKGPVILVDRDILEAAVALQILDAMPPGFQNKQDLVVGQIFELAVVFGGLDDDFVRAHRLHLVVAPVGAPLGIALHTVERIRVRQDRNLRRAMRREAKKCVLGARFLGAKWASARGFTGVSAVADNHPTARNGIFTKFHEWILRQGGGLQKDSFGRRRKIHLGNGESKFPLVGASFRFVAAENQRVYRAGVGPSSRRWRSQIAPSRE